MDVFAHPSLIPTKIHWREFMQQGTFFMITGSADMDALGYIDRTAWAELVARRWGPRRPKMLIVRARCRQGARRPSWQSGYLFWKMRRWLEAGHLRYLREISNWGGRFLFSNDRRSRVLDCDRTFSFLSPVFHKILTLTRRSSGLELRWNMVSIIKALENCYWLVSESFWTIIKAGGFLMAGLCSNTSQLL